MLRGMYSGHYMCGAVYGNCCFCLTTCLTLTSTYTDIHHHNHNHIVSCTTLITIITQETPDVNKENFMKSTTAQKDLWWLVGGRWTTYEPPTGQNGNKAKMQICLPFIQLIKG